MGRNPRRKPVRLAQKLIRIRTELGLSQNEMIRSLGLGEELGQSHISGFEQGTREPSLLVLLQYARIAGVPMEALVDDELDLSDSLSRKSASARKPRRSKTGP
jgi:transcriptional regulator with XRE-family HTH domain